MILPQVYMLTWCTRLDLLEGASLTFKTLRDGFPNCQVKISDACSIAGAKEEFARLAQESDAEFVPLNRQIELFDFIDIVLKQQLPGPAVFIDPDVCLWTSIEDWVFPGIAAGRLIPLHRCEFNNCISLPRLHPSLFWIPEVSDLLEAVAEIRQNSPDFHPFRLHHTGMREEQRLFDTGAALYMARPHQLTAFTPRELDCYDHLFAGTYANEVWERLGPATSSMYRDNYIATCADHRHLKGAWRIQQAYFESRAA